MCIATPPALSYIIEQPLKFQPNKINVNVYFIPVISTCLFELQAFQISNLIREYIEVLQSGLALATEELNRLNPLQQANQINLLNKGPLSVLHKPNPMLVANSSSG